MDTPLWQVSGSQLNPLSRILVKTVDDADAGQDLSLDMAFGTDIFIGWGRPI